MVTNGVDLERFSPGPQLTDVRASLGANGNEILVVYIGAHGISHGLAAVVDAAKSFAPNVRLAFVGEGAEKQMLQQKVAHAGLDNVTFHDGVKREQVSDILRSADLLLVPLRDIPLFESFIPSKMFEFMASGTAIIGSVAGEAAEILEQAGATVVKPEDSNQMASAVNHLASNPQLRKKQSELGREFVVENYDRSILATRYLGELADSAGARI